MERGKIVRGIWRAAWPLLVYWLLSLAVSVLAVLPLGLSIMEGTVLINLVCAALFWLIYRRDRSRGIYRESAVPMEMYAVIWAVSGAAALALLSNQLLNYINLARWSETYREMSHILEQENAGMMLLGAVVTAPIAEELLMRGVLYGRLRSIMPAGWAIPCSALLFGLFHGNLVQCVHAFVIGVFLAWLMERFQNILVPVLGHMAANLSSGFSFPGRGTAEYLLTLAVCAACVVRAVQMLREYGEGD